MTNRTRSINLPTVANKAAFMFLLLALAALIVMAFSATPVQAAKKYSMENVSFVADLHEDGSMAVSEERTYKFKSRFKYAYRTFPLDPRVSYEDFRVSENGQPYVLSDSGEPGTYTVKTKSSEIEVRWHFKARRETRNFKLEYLVQGAVIRNLDGAVLYYKFVGDDFRKSTKMVEITVNPPVEIDQWKIQQWAHGPLWGVSNTSDQGVVTATCENLPRKRFFELRVVYPEELFSTAKIVPEYVLGDIRNEEQAWSDEANLKREQDAEKYASRQKRKATWMWLPPFVVILALGWFFRIASAYGKRPIIPAIDSVSGEIPSDLPPAIVGYLVNERTINGSVMTATLMDLARRGFLEFKEEHELGKNFMGREKWKTRHFWVLNKLHHREHIKELAGFENSLLNFVFEELADTIHTSAATTTVDLELFKKHSSKVQKFFSEWSKEIQAEAEGYNLFDKASFQGRNQGFMTGGALFLLALAMIPLVWEFAFIPGIAGVIIFLGSLAIVHHTAEGLILDKKWKALRTYLKKQKFKDTEPSTVLESIEPYFIYGVALGLDKKQLVGLGSMIPQNNAGFYMIWYHHNQNDGAMAGASFGESFSTAMAGVNTAMSSSTGAGGGASGGGGGGAGGGGGGAG